MSACGTAYYAGLVAKYWFEALLRACRRGRRTLPSSATARGAGCRRVDCRFSCRSRVKPPTTLATLRYAKEHKQHALAVVNVPTSTIARESHAVMPTLAGPEIGVASTQAFTLPACGARLSLRSRPAAPAGCCPKRGARRWCAR